MPTARMTQGRSAVAPLFRLAAKFARLRSFSIGAICRLEGGQMWSLTYRELMRSHYDIGIGMYSYGPPFYPGGLPEGTRVGNYCSLAEGMRVFRRNHPTERIALHPFFYNSGVGVVPVDSIASVSDNRLTVEDDVWIGANVVITPRCKIIGLGAVVGAAAVVTKDVPPFAIMAGNPARQIGIRFSVEIQKVVLESKWWTHPIGRLIPVLPIFLENATLETANRLNAHLRSSHPA